MKKSMLKCSCFFLLIHSNIVSGSIVGNNNSYCLVEFVVNSLYVIVYLVTLFTYLNIFIAIGKRLGYQMCTWGFTYTLGVP